MYVYLNFVLILNQCLNFVLVHCIYCIFVLYLETFLYRFGSILAPFVTNMFKQFINLFFLLLLLLLLYIYATKIDKADFSI